MPIRLLLIGALAAPLALALEPSPAAEIDGDTWFKTLSWRCIGPSRGGRASSVCGVRGDALTYYMGACGDAR